MKGLLHIVFGLLVSAVITNAQSYISSGTTIFGDVRIQTLKNGTIWCDSMICPQKASHCRVTKRTDPTNSQEIVRHRSCLDGTGAVILEEKVNEPNPSNRKVYVDANSGKFGNWVNNRTELTPEEQRELDEKLRRRQQERDERLRQRQQEREERLSRQQQELRRKQQEREETFRRRQQERDENLRRREQEREERLSRQQQELRRQQQEREETFRQREQERDENLRQREQEREERLRRRQQEIGAQMSGDMDY